MAIIFLIWLCILAAYDFQFRRAPNFLILIGFGMAIMNLISMPNHAPIQIALYESLLGGGGAFFVMLIFYGLGIMGAGDVKFGAVLGLWVGWELLLIIWALSCAFSVLHGLIAQSNWRYCFHALNWRDRTRENGKRFIPYVTYLSAATVIVLMINK